MAIAREFHGKGWTGDQYDELIARMNLAGHSAPGVLFHWAAVTTDGVHAVDVYESRQAADHLAQRQVGPSPRNWAWPHRTSASTRYGAT